MEARISALVSGIPRVGLCETVRWIDGSYVDVIIVDFIKWMRLFVGAV